MNANTKSVLHNARSVAGRIASILSFSLYPRHLKLIRLRERELNIGKSYLLQVLLDIEEREGLLRRELIARYTTQPMAESPASIPRQKPQ